MLLTTALLALAITGRANRPCVTDTVMLRGKPQSLHLCGDPDGAPMIVSSGDGGWIRLAPHVAHMLAGRGCFVVGFDSKAYLASFTGSATTLTLDEVASDFGALVDYVARRARGRPTLVGVSEGAALSVAAAANVAVKPRLAGVIALGLGDVNELAWRWTDSIIYFTKRNPDEPSFRTSALIHQVSPLPLALIQSAKDEYVPRAEAERLARLARQPARVWTIPASDHAFSDNRSELDARLAEAMTWIAGIAGSHAIDATSNE